MPIQIPDYHMLHDTLHLGCEKPRAYFVPYHNIFAAERDLRAGSRFFYSLCGTENFSVSASHFTPEQLTAARHNHELKPNPETTVVIDYRQSGIGSNSCGPELEPEFRFSEKNFSFRFRLLSCFANDVDGFEEMRRRF